MRCCVTWLLLIGLTFTSAFSRSRHHRRGESSSTGQAGSFDYYILSLSWSPDFCATHADAPECGGAKKFGFVVHGLWPQNERGYPKGCAGAKFDRGQLPPDLHNIMPSDQLIQHEWESHGTCSGLPELEYFKTLERAYNQIRIPADYQAPLRNIEVAPGDVKQKFVRENASFPPAAFSVQCSGNRFLREVRVCMTRDLRPRACGAGVRDTCKAERIIMRPLR